MDDRPSFKTLARRIIGKTRQVNLYIDVSKLNVLMFSQHMMSAIMLYLLAMRTETVFVNEGDPNGFMFFRHKMAAMIAYFLMDAGLVPMFYTPVPVDIHVLRVLVSNQVIRVRGKSTRKTIGTDFMKTPAQRLARKVTEWYCRKYNISPVALGDTLWLLSRTLCRLNPGNSGYVVDDKRHADLKMVRKSHDDHPMLDLDMVPTESVSDPERSEDEDSGRNGRKRYIGLKYSMDKLFSPSMTRRFEKSCDICPIKNTCRFNISSGAYYTGGMLLPERARFRPPDNQVNFLDHPAFRSSFGGMVDPTVRFAQINMPE